MSVASARPTWRVALRSLGEMTRLAVAALALAVGLGAAASAPAGPPATVAQLQPNVVSSQVEVLRPEAAPVAERLSPTDTPVRRPVRGPILAAPAAGSMTPAPETSTALDAGRVTPGRRGPPLA